MKTLKAVLLSLAIVSICRAGTKPLVVSADGTGDFKTVQEAIDAAPAKSTETVVIHIKPGTYAGQLIIPKEKPHLSLEGESAETTTVTWDRNVYDPRPDGADKFNPSLQVRSDEVTISNLTIENTSGDHGQALAMRIDSDRVTVKNCRLIGWQDTLMANNGRHYFKDCYITGRVDFIYGSGTSWFENCQIHSRNGGYVTASSAPQSNPFGFVFRNCKLTGDEIPWNPATTNPATTQKAKPGDKRTYLGRPWRDFAAVAFLNCEMGDHIRAEGWHNWGKPEREKTSRYLEYGSTGPGAKPENRVSWARQLSKEEAEKITPEAVLSGADNWKPFSN